MKSSLVSRLTASGTETFSDESLDEDDKKCLGRIFYVKQESDITSWYEVWEAFTAVYSVCIRNQRCGTSRGLG